MDKPELSVSPWIEDTPEYGEALKNARAEKTAPAAPPVTEYENAQAFARDYLAANLREENLGDDAYLKGHMNALLKHIFHDSPTWTRAFGAQQANMTGRQLYDKLSTWAAGDAEALRTDDLQAFDAADVAGKDKMMSRREDTPYFSDAWHKLQDMDARADASARDYQAFTTEMMSEGDERLAGANQLPPGAMLPADVQAKRDEIVGEAKRGMPFKEAQQKAATEMPEAASVAAKAKRRDEYRGKLEKQSLLYWMEKNSFNWMSNKTKAAVFAAVASGEISDEAYNAMPEQERPTAMAAIHALRGEAAPFRFGGGWENAWLNGGATDADIQANAKANSLADKDDRTWRENLWLLGHDGMRVAWGALKLIPELVVETGRFGYDVGEMASAELIGGETGKDLYEDIRLRHEKNMAMKRDLPDAATGTGKIASGFGDNIGYAGVGSIGRSGVRAVERGVSAAMRMASSKVASTTLKAAEKKATGAAAARIGKQIAAQAAEHAAAEKAASTPFKWAGRRLARAAEKKTATELAIKDAGRQVEKQVGALRALDGAKAEVKAAEKELSAAESVLRGKGLPTGMTPPSNAAANYEKAMAKLEKAARKQAHIQANVNGFRAGAEAERAKALWHDLMTAREQFKAAGKSLERLASGTKFAAHTAENALWYTHFYTHHVDQAVQDGTPLPIAMKSAFVSMLVCGKLEKAVFTRAFQGRLSPQQMTAESWRAIGDKVMTAVAKGLDAGSLKQAGRLFASRMASNLGHGVTSAFNVTAESVADELALHLKKVYDKSAEINGMMSWESFRDAFTPTKEWVDSCCQTLDNSGRAFFGFALLSPIQMRWGNWRRGRAERAYNRQTYGEAAEAAAPWENFSADMDAGLLAAAGNVNRATQAARAYWARVALDRMEQMQHLRDGAVSIWENAPDFETAAKQIKEQYGLTDEQTQKVTDWLSRRDVAATEGEAEDQGEALKQSEAEMKGVEKAANAQAKEQLTAESLMGKTSRTLQAALEVAADGDASTRTVENLMKTANVDRATAEVLLSVANDAAILRNSTREAREMYEAMENDYTIRSPKLLRQAILAGTIPGVKSHEEVADGVVFTIDLGEGRGERTFGVVTDPIVTKEMMAEGLKDNSGAGVDYDNAVDAISRGGSKAGIVFDANGNPVRWAKLNEQQRLDILEKYNAGIAMKGGHVYVQNEDGSRSSMDVDDLISLVRGHSSTFTLRHETGHSLYRMAKDMGYITPEAELNFAHVLGIDTKSADARTQIDDGNGRTTEKWRVQVDEAMADGFADFTSGVVTPTSPQLAEWYRKATSDIRQAKAMGRKAPLFARFVNSLVDAMVGSRPAWKRTTVTTPSSLDGVYKAMMLGDWAAVGRSAGELTAARVQHEKERSQLEAKLAAERQKARREIADRIRAEREEKRKLRAKERDQKLKTTQEKARANWIEAERRAKEEADFWAELDAEVERERAEAEERARAELEARQKAELDAWYAQEEAKEKAEEERRKANERMDEKALRNRQEEGSRKMPRLRHSANQTGEEAQRARKAYEIMWHAKKGHAISEADVAWLGEEYGLPPEAIGLVRSEKDGKASYKFDEETAIPDGDSTRLQDAMVRFFGDVASVRIVVPDVYVATRDDLRRTVANEVYDPVAERFVTGRVVVNPALARTFRQQAGEVEKMPYKVQPHVPGTAVLPAADAKGIKAYEINADGTPSTQVRDLKPGAYNLLRGPYDTSRPARLSAQDIAGRGLGSLVPRTDAKSPWRKWGDIFPRFMGWKKDMADRTSIALRNTMTEEERLRYDTVVDYFGGGGCWGLFHALANFPNARKLIVNEYEPARLGKIRLLHEVGEQVATEAETILKNPALLEQIVEWCKTKDNPEGSSSGATIANKVTDNILNSKDFNLTDHQRAVLTAFVDCCSRMLGTIKGEGENLGTVAGIDRALKALAEDGRKAKAAADEFKERGGTIEYHAGDAMAFADETAHGDRTVAVADPPYYLTAAYQTEDGKDVLVPLESDSMWSYAHTRDFMQKLVDFGDAIVYTDEAWWYKEGYKTDSNPAEHKKEQSTLLDIINTLDHFDVCGRVKGRQETLGIGHGHKTKKTAQRRADGQPDSSADVRAPADQHDADERGSGSVLPPVQPMAADAQGQDGQSGQNGGTGRPQRPRPITNAARWRERLSQRAADGRSVTPAVVAEEQTHSEPAAFRITTHTDEDTAAEQAESLLAERDASLKAALEENDKKHADALVHLDEMLHPKPRPARSDATIDQFLEAHEGDLSRFPLLSWYRDNNYHIFNWPTKGDVLYDRVKHMEMRQKQKSVIFGFKNENKGGNDALARELGSVFPQFAEKSAEEILDAFLDEHAQFNAWKADGAKTAQELAEEADFANLLANANGEAGARLLYGALADLNAVDIMERHGVVSAEDAEGMRDAIVNAPDVHDIMDRAGMLPSETAALEQQRQVEQDEIEYPDGYDVADIIGSGRWALEMGRKARQEAERMIMKFHPWRFEGERDEDIFNEGEREKLVKDAVDQIAAFETPKERKAALLWYCKNTIRLPEDSAKVAEAIKTAERAKVDPMQFERPGEILEKYAKYIPKAPPINPDAVPELTDRREMGNGIVTYLVQDDKAGQAAMRKIINTHFGKNASPWCLLQGDNEGSLTDNAWGYWQHYNALPKRVAFRNGKLCAFMATDKAIGDYTDDGIWYEFEHRDDRERARLVKKYKDETGASLYEYGALTKAALKWLKTELQRNSEEWWDRQDAPHNGIPFTETDAEGRTLSQEQHPDGSVVTTQITRGDPKAESGTYEEWNPTASEDSAYYKITKRVNGRDYDTRTFYRNGQPRTVVINDGNGNSETTNFFPDGTPKYHSLYNYQTGESNVSYPKDGRGIYTVAEREKSWESAEITTSESGQNVVIRRNDLDADGRPREWMYRFENGELAVLGVQPRSGAMYEQIQITDGNRLYLPHIDFAELDELMSAAWADGKSLPTPLSRMATKQRPASQVRHSLQMGASRALRETAHRAMPDTKVLDKDGLPLVVYHGTPNGGFYVFGGHRTRNGAQPSASFWFAAERDYARNYTENADWSAGENPQIYPVFLNATKIAHLGNCRVEAMGYNDQGEAIPSAKLKEVARKIGCTPDELLQVAKDHYCDFVWQVTEQREFADIAQAHGFDGLTATENGHLTYGVFNPAQIKSADEVTRDDNGNVIPLSQRFNPEVSDIRYALQMGERSIRQQREDRISEFAEFMSENPQEWIANASARLDQRMKSKGYTEKVWHGTSGKDFNVFHFSADSHDVPAAYFTYKRGTAENYAVWRDEDYGNGPNIRQFYVNPGKMLELDERIDPTDIKQFVKKLADAYAQGYNSVLVRNALDDQGARLDENDANPTFMEPDEAPGDGEGNFETDILIVMKQPGDNAEARIKAADAVTFAADGTPINPDERANRRKADVRYSLDIGTEPIKTDAETPAQREQMRNSLFIGTMLIARNNEEKGSYGFRAYLHARTMLREEYAGKYTDEAREKIYVDTGWWQGTDGKWRVEIPDMKRKVVPELGDGTYRGTDANFIKLKDLVSNDRLFKVYPTIRDMTVYFVDADADILGDASGFFDGENIVMTWDDLTSLDALDGEIKLTDDGIATLTHEVQHAIQREEAFAHGGSVENLGRWRYRHIAGEVEARNAERRMFGPWPSHVGAKQDSVLRAMLTRVGNAPWQTEDVKTPAQMLYGQDGTVASKAWADDHPEWKRSESGGYENNARKEAEVAQMRASLALPPQVARKFTVDELLAMAASAELARTAPNSVSRKLAEARIARDAERRLKLIGDGKTDAKSLRQRADRILQEAKQGESSLRGVTTRATKQQLVDALQARQVAMYRRSLERAAREASEAGAEGEGADAELNRRIASKAADEIAAQTGIAANELESTLGIDLAKTLLNVRRLRMEGEDARRDENGEKADEDAGEETDVTPPEDMVPTEEKMAREAEIRELIQQIVERTEREVTEAEARREAARKAREEAEDDAEADADGAEAETGESAEEAVARMALEKKLVNLENPEHFARFIAALAETKWKRDHGITAEDAYIWGDPVAMQHLRMTALNVYNEMARTLMYSNRRETAMRKLRQIEDSKGYLSCIASMAECGRIVAAGMIRETQDEMVSEIEQQLEQAFGARGRFKQNEEDIHRKVTGLTELWARDVKKVLRWSEEKVAEAIDEILRRKDTTELEFAVNGRNVDASRQFQKDVRMLSALQGFGALIHRSPGEISDARLRIIDRIENDTVSAEAAEREARTKEMAATLAKAFETGKVQAYDERTVAAAISRNLQGHLDFKKLLLDLTRYCKDDATRQAATEFIDNLQHEIQRRHDAAKTEVRQQLVAFRDAVQRIYGEDPYSVIARLCKHDERFDQFGRGEVNEDTGEATMVKMSKAAAMQLYVSTQQKGYIENVKANGRQGQGQAIRALLDPQDLQLLKWMGDWYEKERGAISDVSEKLFGLPVLAEEANYFPVKILLPSQGPEKPNAVTWSPFPPALTPRVRHRHDFDVRMTVFDLWTKRMTEQAQWKQMAELGVEMRGIFGRQALQSTIRRCHGGHAVQGILQFITDILNGQYRDVVARGSVDAVDKVRGWACYAGLGGNAGVMLKQMTSIPAFALEIGVGRTVKYIATAVTPAGLSAMREIWNSEQRRNRWDSGNSEEVTNALNDKNPGLIKQLLIKSMALNRIGDIVPTLVVGQGIYRALLRQGISQEEAMNRMWEIANRTQQTSQMDNLTAIQRRSSLGRAFFQFASAVRQYLSYEIADIRKLIAQPGVAKNWVDFCRTTVLTCGVLPAAYFLMGELWKMAKGKDPDEDLWTNLVGSCLASPWSSLFFYGMIADGLATTLTTGKRPWGNSASVPALQFAENTITALGQMGYDLTAMAYDALGGEMDNPPTIEDFLKAANRFMRSASAPYRDISDAIKNYGGEDD